MQKDDTSPRPQIVSARSSPALSTNTVPATDSDWSTMNDWSLPASRQPSRSSTPALSMAPPTSIVNAPSELSKPLPDFTSWMKTEDAQNILAQAQQPGWLLPTPRDAEDPTAFDLPISRSRGKSHIPRPPNAFMLFRAEKVNAELPRDLPNRQQVVSIVAGQCWNMLDDKGKAEWHSRAREMLRKHMERYPDYKFSPSRRSSRKKVDEVEAKDGEEYIRHLREKYMQMHGPTVVSTRTRKAKPRKSKGVASDVQLAPHHPSLSSIHPGPLAPYHVDSSSFNFAPFASPVYPSYPHGQMPAQPSVPFMGHTQELDFTALAAAYMHGSRTTTPSPVPSTSSEGSSSGMSTPSDEEVAHHLDDDKTPTAASFGRIAIPRVPIVPNISHYANANHMLNLHELSPYANMFQQHQHQTQSSGSSSSAPCRDVSAVAYYSAIFPSGMQSNPCADIPSSSTTSSPAPSIPVEVRETFGVKGNSSR
ncbi:hypothetical protein BXZ70DRAFT_409339 [Cristinia sonorae]|uniref:HMG box domain-containing protein n=1 Tax=Cristinia sonorae TaxID=1940300 RepID=A0A8K0UXG0_9AGAR|nr:hypothetical protein BXZ70DRAFT_409339 [Cristinia sonorae]